MASSNVEIVRSGMDGFNRGDFESGLQLFRPDVAAHDPDRAPALDSMHG